MSDAPFPTGPDAAMTRPDPAMWQPAFWSAHPGFQSIAEPAARICRWSSWPEPASYYAALSAQAPVRFVGADVLSYEDHVAATGEVPTRYASWHDLLNALIWHRYPASKHSLNRLHLAAKQQLPDGQRGRRRDAATLFDENGAVVWSDRPALLHGIRSMDWPQLFWQQRAVFERHVRVRLFGHGLLDQLRAPFLGLTAHALLLELPPDLTDEQLDQHVAEHITQQQSHWTPADLAPLPMLGIPGWWPGNDTPAFYENRQYFRRERRRQPPRP